MQIKYTANAVKLLFGCTIRKLTNADFLLGFAQHLLIALKQGAVIPLNICVSVDSLKNLCKFSVGFWFPQSIRKAEVAATGAVGHRR